MPNKSVFLFKRCFVDIGFDVCNGLRHWNCLLKLGKYQIPMDLSRDLSLQNRVFKNLFNYDIYINQRWKIRVTQQKPQYSIECFQVAIGRSNFDQFVLALKKKTNKRKHHQFYRYFLINISFYFHSSTYYLILLLQQFSPHKKLN